MARQTKNSEAVKRLLGKSDEPRYDKLESQGAIASALNWYQNNKDAKDAVKYISEYLKKNKIKGRLNTDKSFTTVAYLCRIVYNGAQVSDEVLKSLDARLKEVLITKEPTKIVEDAPKKPVVSIQDRVAEKVSEIIGELEGSIDDLVLSDFKIEPSPYGIMHDKAKAMHAGKIIEWAKRRRQEFDEVIDTKDKELKEGYSNFTKTQLKKLVSYCDSIITDAGKISGESKANRKPRKRKVKTPEQLVAKVSICQESTEYKLKSESPKNIIGAMQIWVFNVKTRKLGTYHALDSEGFGVKGTSLTNFSEMKSVQKTLRKPEAILPDVVKGGKVFLRNVMDSVNAKASPLTGRLNADTILVKIIK
jgi:hypothetical protein